MSKTFMLRILLSVCLMIAATAPTTAALVKTEFDWVQEWANIEGSQNSVKQSILRALDRCAGPSIKQTDIKTYETDLNKDGLSDYIVDLKAIAKDTKPTCDDLPCVGKDCYIWDFVKKQPDATQMLVSKKPSDPACPPTAGANTSCLNYCAATKAQCPLLFRDVYFLVWNGRAVDWQMHATNDLPKGRSITPNPAFGNVLSIKLGERDGLCNDQEISQNGGECVKYYQWDSNIHYLRDIWRPVVSTSGSWPQEDMYNFTRWNHQTLTKGKGEQIIDNTSVNGFAIKLKPGSNISINSAVGKEGTCEVACPEVDGDGDTAEDCREVVTHESVEDCHYEDSNGKQVVNLPPECTNTDMGRKLVDMDNACDQKKICTTKIIDKTSIICVPKKVTIGDDVTRKDGACFKTCYKDFKYTCMDMKSDEAVSYFIPNNTPEEFSSFYNHLPSKVKVSECERRYTPWQGNPTAVEFLRGRAKGTPLTSDVCALITDIPCDSSVVVSLTRGCEASLGNDLDCGQCNIDTRIDAADRNLSCSQTVTCFGAACPVVTPTGGDGGGGGGDCIAGDVLVNIDTHKAKEASELKVGDTVLGFTAANPEHIFKTKIKEIKVTPGVQLMSVNDVETNAIHVFLTQSRGPVAANDLKISDLLIKSGNTTEVVKDVKRLETKAPVYTIILENADGYIANGYLVFSKSKDVTVHPKAKAVK